MPSICKRTVVDEEKKQAYENLDYYGYCVIPQLLKQEIIVKLKEKSISIWDKLKDNEYKNDKGRFVNNKLIQNIHNTDQTFLDLLDIVIVREVLSSKLNDPYFGHLPKGFPNYILSNYSARSPVDRLELHIDSFLPSPGEETWSLQVFFLLDDHTKDNGCTCIVPGSHRSGRFSDRNFFDRARPIEAKAGDVVILDSRCWHGNLANPLMHDRWTLIATVTRWWVRPDYDMPRILPEKIYKGLNERQKVLIGYCALLSQNEFDKFHTKSGLDSLKATVRDYFTPTDNTF